MQQQLSTLPKVFIAVFAMGLSVSTFASEEQSMSQIHIAMGGTPGAEFSAHWRITHDGQTIEHIEEHATVPKEYTFIGSSLEGTVTLLSDSQRLDVDIQKGGNRSRSSTQGLGSTVTVGVR